MSGHEPGDPNNYPAEVALVDDAALPTAANFNPGLQDLADRTACIRTHGLLKLMKQTFLIDGTWTKPAALHGGVIFVDMCGGGGGGGYGGTSTANAADLWASGGAGGGGALRRQLTIDVSAVVDGFVADVHPGDGGAGGGIVGANGSDGDFSYVDFSGLPDRTYIAHGGAGGAAGKDTTTSNQPVIALGGPPMAGARVVNHWIAPTAVTGAMLPLLQPGQGGHATTQNFPSLTVAGATNPTIGDGTSGTSGNGGSAGTAGTDSSTRRGGGAGGGGGGGPYGLGGNGGNGGNGNNAGAGAAATAGASAAANSGAGGGGGGAGGYGSTSKGNNAAGGNGGSGRVTILWWEKGVELP